MTSTTLLIVVMIFLSSASQLDSIKLINNDEVQKQPLEETNSSFTDERMFNIQLTEHEPITIDGNADFASQATNEGWSGDGFQKQSLYY